MLFRSTAGPILEGSRNNTMSRLAGRILKRYGNTEKAHVSFLEFAQKCDPPLSDEELSTIWNSAVKFYKKKVVTQDGYVEPDEYNSDFDSESLKPEDYSDIGEAKILVREYGEEIKYSAATVSVMTESAGRKMLSLLLEQSRSFWICRDRKSVV